MEDPNKVREAAKALEEPIGRLVDIFEDLLKEYHKKGIPLKDKLAVARELSKVADILLKRDKKEKSKQLANMESLYDDMTQGN